MRLHKFIPRLWILKSRICTIDFAMRHHPKIFLPIAVVVCKASLLMVDASWVVCCCRFLRLLACMAISKEPTTTMLSLSLHSELREKEMLVQLAALLSHSLHTLGHDPDADRLTDCLFVSIGRRSEQSHKCCYIHTFVTILAKLQHSH